MKNNLGNRIGLVLFLCLVLLSLSCGGKVTTRTDGEEKQFTVNGVVVKDLNSGKDIAYFAILRDGNPFDGALVKVGSDTLINQGNGNYFLEGSQLFNFEQNISVNISSAEDNFTLNTSVKMPGSFQIKYFNPPIVTSDEAHLVKIYGSSSAGADGYFVSIIRPDGNNGHTGLVSLIQMIEGASLPRDTFGEGGAFITGTYEVYAVAYHGSFLHYPGMEFYLPAGLPADNISGADGTIGVGVVAPLDSIRAQ